MKKLIRCLLACPLFFMAILHAQSLVKPVTITVDAGSPADKPLPPIWSFFGYDEANYTYMKDGKKLLSELAALSPAQVYVRAHNLLTTGNGVPALKWSSTNAYTEDAQGKPIYNWKIVDSIFDTYKRLGMKPLVEVGFMINPDEFSKLEESETQDQAAKGLLLGLIYYLQDALDTKSL